MQLTLVHLARKEPWRSLRQISVVRTALHLHEAIKSLSTPLRNLSEHPKMKQLEAWALKCSVIVVFGNFQSNMLGTIATQMFYENYMGILCKSIGPKHEAGLWQACSRTRLTTRIGLFLAISIFIWSFSQMVPAVPASPERFCSTPQYIVDKDKTMEKDVMLLHHTSNMSALIRE